MKKVAVGLIPAPGMPLNLINEMSENFRKILTFVIDEEVDWQIDYEANPLTTSSEYINEAFDKAEEMGRRNNWDLVIAISDLPSVSNNKIVISEFNDEKGVSLISLPALGVYQIKKKLQNLLVHHVEVLYDKETGEQRGDISSEFINKITSVKPSEDQDTNARYILKSAAGGWVRLVAGMTHLNEPLTAITNLKTIVAVAFATGTYISIFATPWELSLEYSLWRFVLLMMISVFGMTGWLIYAHNLWEFSSSRNQTAYQSLYNLTTLVTLLSITIIKYIIVLMLLTISIVAFVPMELFEGWTDTADDVNWMDYSNLIWFSTSVGVLAGAFGSTAEDEGAIRKVTYTYRQKHRDQELDKKESTMESVESEAADYEGDKQTHEESEEEK